MAPGGYVWWYLDALSEDRRSGLTIIAFIGSVFSPYYAWSGRGDPMNHCAVNVALYGDAAEGWAMTERSRASVTRDAVRLVIGPSSLTWADGALTVRFDETTAPRRSRLRGEVRLTPRAVNRATFGLDAAGRHAWRPIAPRARVEVSLADPAAAWSGEGYFDTNAGDEPLENAFSGWEWSRAHLNTDTLLFYDLAPRSGDTRHLALRFGPDGVARAVTAPPKVRLPVTGWRIPRHGRGETPEDIGLGRTLEDTPFYARSALRGRYGGEAAEIIHESLSLDRLRSPIVRAMLPFRMPRILW